MSRQLRFASMFALLVAMVLGPLSAPSAQAADPQQSGSPPRTLIRNASLVLTMDPALGEGELGMLENADVLMADGKIVAVGHNLDAQGARVVDATGKIVMPGFVDTHNHLWQTVIRGCGTDKNVVDWLTVCTRGFGRNPLTESEAYAAVRLGTLDVLSSGITTVVDWSSSQSFSHDLGNLSALEDSGLRFVYVYRYRRNLNPQQFLRTLVDERINPNPLASLHISAHPSAALATEVRDVVTLAHELNVPVNVHLLENIKDRVDNPVQVLQNAGALNGELIVNHAVHLTDAEIELLASHEVRVAHNPLSNMRLASGVMPIQKMRAAGMTIGLGLDGGANDTSDMFNNMRAAVGLQRAVHMDAGVHPTVPEVLRMATIEGAAVLGMEDQIGSLTPGKQADVIIINPHAVNFGPKFDWISQIVFNGQPQNVEWVFVAGQPLMQDGKLVHVHVDRIIDEAEVVVLRVKQFLGF